MPKYFVATLLLALSVAVFVIAGGCQDGRPQADPPFKAESGWSSLGTLRVRVHDKKIGDQEVTHVWITIKEVRAHRGGQGDDKGWFLLSVPSERIDLLELVDGRMSLLGDNVLPSGSYDQIRLVLGEDNEIEADGVTHALKVPSGETSGLKLKGIFDVVAGHHTDVSLDFDLEHSITITGEGEYHLKPVIHVKGSPPTPLTAEELRADVVGAWIDSAGGSVALPGGFEIEVPAGALNETAFIAARQGPSTAFGSAYEALPHGIQFAAPVGVTIPFSPTKVESFGATPATVGIYQDDLAVASTALGAASRQVWVTHFSFFWPDATEKVCKTTNDGVAWCRHVVIHTDCLDPLPPSGCKLKPIFFTTFEFDLAGVTSELLYEPAQEAGRFVFRTAPEFYASASDPKPFLVMNAGAFDPDAWKSGDEGTPVQTLIANGSVLRDLDCTHDGTPEAHFAFSNQDHLATVRQFRRTGKSDQAVIAECMGCLEGADGSGCAASFTTLPSGYDSVVIGARTTLAWDGNFTNQCNSECLGNQAFGPLPSDISGMSPRVAIGVTAARDRLVGVVSDVAFPGTGIGAQDVYDILSVRGTHARCDDGEAVPRGERR